ncbi:hypothetical protein ABIB40_002995 [Pedobacter sp. UYP30]|uniref:hypothetical protein n=1 Tax=Pedobacter sp. UYP30 TaxID=1756400 RepID=UPI0033999505
MMSNQSGAILLEAIRQTLQKKKVRQLAALAGKDFRVKDLIDLTLDRDKKIGFRAAWILENIYSNHQERFLSYTRYFLDRFCDQTNLSALRHYVKMLTSMTNKSASIEVAELLAEYNLDAIISAVFRRLIDEATPVATKAFCLDILANLSTTHIWIKTELLETMDFLVAKESVGFFARVKKIRKQLTGENRKFE